MINVGLVCIYLAVVGLIGFWVITECNENAKRVYRLTIRSFWENPIYMFHIIYCIRGIFLSFQMRKSAVDFGNSSVHSRRGRRDRVHYAIITIAEIRKKGTIRRKWQCCIKHTSGDCAEEYVYKYSFFVSVCGVLFKRECQRCI